MMPIKVLYGCPAFDVNAVHGHPAENRARAPHLMRHGLFARLALLSGPFGDQSRTNRAQWWFLNFEVLWKHVLRTERRGSQAWNTYAAMVPQAFSLVLSCTL